MCGEIPKTASSRITNAEDSDVHYPWVVRVIREFEKEGGNITVFPTEGGNFYEELCGGTILNEKYDQV